MKQTEFARVTLVTLASAAWDVGAHEYVHPTADTDGDVLRETLPVLPGARFFQVIVKTN